MHSYISLNIAAPNKLICPLLSLDLKLLFFLLIYLGKTVVNISMSSFKIHVKKYQD